MKRIAFYLRSCLESQVFFKKIWAIDMMSLYGEADIVIGNVYFPFFTLRSL